MKVAEKYKQTEVGLIPSDWEVISLGEVFEFKNGLNKEKHFFGKGTPIVNYMDVFKNSGLKSDDLSGRVTLSPQEIKNFDVRKGDVFFTRTSETVEEIGISAVMLEDVKNTVFSGFVLRARPTNDKLDLEFKKYCFSTKEVRKEITSKSSYTTRALTNGRLLSAVKLAIPPTKAEQTAIATALSNADALISSLEKLIAKKRMIKQGAMQQLLQPKEGWEVKKLGEIANFYSGGTPNTSVESYYGGNIDWITSGDLNKKIIYEVEGKITDDGLNHSSSKMIKANTLLLALYGATAGVVGISKIDAAINQAVLAFILKENYSTEFIYYKLSHLKDWIIITYTQGGQPNLSGGIIKSIELSFPSFEEQTHIATILSDMDAEITTLEAKLEKYRKVKLGMMQNLLTGKIRLV